MQCAKMLDSQAALMTWDEEEGVKNLNGDEIKMISDQSIEKYIDMPPVEGMLNTGEVYYGNGIRIKTCMDVDKFVEKWNNKKYDTGKNSPFKNWKAVRRAEMQKYAVAYPVGYLAGTTERGFYDTVCESLTKEFNDRIELSFQTVYQPGVSTRVWKLARDTAEKQYLNDKSRNFKMIKFAMAPSALTVYVGGKKFAQEIRKKFIYKYGQVENEKWPTMADGSKMRFIPIVKGYVDDNEAREKLYRHLKHQATSKAGEVKLNFPYQDVNTRKSYFGEKTLEQVIHEMTTKKDTEVPIFKHITTKWMQKDTGIQQYEIAVANSLVDEATTVLRGLKNYLIKTYGNDARNHFAGAKNDKKIAIPRKRNFTLFNTDWDDNIGKFIKQTDNTDKLSKVLIEGMEMILDPQNMNYQNKNDKEGALVFNEAPKHKEEETKTKDTKEPKEVEKKITNINRKLEKKDIIVIDDEDEQRQVQENAQSEAINQGGKYLEQKEWYDIALGGEYERCIVATDDETRKTLINTLRKYKIHRCRND